MVENTQPPSRAAGLLARLRSGDGHFIRSIFVYGLGQVALKGFDLVSFAFLVHAMTPVQLGFVGAMVLLGYFISDVLSLSFFRVGVPRFAVDDAEDRAVVLSAALGGFLVYLAVVGGLVLLDPGMVGQITGLNGFSDALRLYCFSFVLRTFVYMELELMRMDQRVRMQSFVEATPSAINLAVLVLLLPLFHDKVLASAWACMAQWGIPFAYYFPRAWLSRRPSLRGSRRILGYAAPLTLHRMMADINNMASRWVVLLTLGLSATGAFTFYTRVGELMRLANAPMQKAWEPAAIQAKRTGDKTRANRAAMVFMVLATAIFIAALLSGRFIAMLLDSQGKFASSYSGVSTVAFANWVLTFQYIFAVGYYTEKKPVAIIPISATTAALNIGLSYIAAKHYGILAVPYAAALANVFFSVTCFIFGRRYFTFTSPRVWQTAAACAVTGVVAFVIERMLTQW